MTLAAEALSHVSGYGDPQADLLPAELRDILVEPLSTVSAGSSVLAIIADKTRDDNTDVLFPAAARILADRRIAKLDGLIAQGTHAPMSERDKRVKIGADVTANIPGLGDIFDHDWVDPSNLTTIGRLDAACVRALSAGLMDTAIDLKVNSKRGFTTPF
jgi:nickel-dependent lactate racemase